METELNESVEDFIDSIKITIDRELEYVKLKSWVDSSDYKKKQSNYDIHRLLVDRALKNAVKLYNLVKGDIRPKEVSGMLKSLASFFTYFEKRVNQYISENDWTASLFDVENKDGLMKLEIEFQSQISKDIVEFKSRLKQINLDENNKKIKIATFNDKPVPFLMRHIIEEKHPEVKVYMEAKMTKPKEEVAKKPRVAKKKSK